MSFNININDLYTAHFAHKYGNTSELVCRISEFNAYQFRLFGTIISPDIITIPSPSQKYDFIGFILCK